MIVEMSCRRTISASVSRAPHGPGQQAGRTAFVTQCRSQTPVERVGFDKAASHALPAIFAVRGSGRHSGAAGGAGRSTGAATGVGRSTGAGGVSVGTRAAGSR